MEMKYKSQECSISGNLFYTSDTFSERNINFFSVSSEHSIKIPQQTKPTYNQTMRILTTTMTWSSTLL